MTSLVDLFPPFGLRIVAGPLELRMVRDEDLAGLAAVAAGGVHAPDAMPFYFPWTDGTPEEVARAVAAYQWRKRGEFSVAQWSLPFGVWYDGALVGIQGIDAQDYLVTRTGETGSWLGLAHQGRGIGTAMRQAICAFMFDHAGAEELTSGAFLDNPASLAVSRKVGYRTNGVQRYTRRDVLAENQMLVLRPDALVRGTPLEVEGVEGFRPFIGLDAS